MKSLFTALGLSLILASIAMASEKTCLQEVGKTQVKQYVSLCIDVSPATHPPCNPVNPCSLIVDEIKRGCGLLKADKQLYPKMCDDYLDAKPGADKPAK